MNAEKLLVSHFSKVVLPLAMVAVLAIMVPSAVQATPPSPYVDHVVPPTLNTQVNQLVASAVTQQQKLRAATLQWALNQAAYQFSSTTQVLTGTTPWVRTASFLASDTTTVLAPAGVAPADTYDLQYSPLGIGDSLVSDVQDNLNNGTQIGTPNADQYPLGYDLFPKIPNYPVGVNGQPVNAIASQVIGYIPTYITSGSMSPYYIQPMEVFGFPDSPYYGDPRLVPIMFNAMEKGFDTFFIIANGGGNFASSPGLAMEYALVAARYPDLILPSVAKRWEACLHNQAALYYSYNASYSATQSNIGLANPPATGTFLVGDPARAYPNADFTTAVFMYYASIALSAPLNHNNYSPNVATNLRNAVYSYLHLATNKAVLFPDGGFTYVYGSNECGEYHGIAVSAAENLYLLTKPLTGSADVAARADLASLLTGSKLYFPLEFAFAGASHDDAEYPAWKHGFASSPFYECRGMMGSMHPDLSTSTDPQLWRVFDETGSFAHEGQQMSLLDAACVDTSKDPFAGSVAAAKLADKNNFFLYDQNRQGPNARFGSWAMFGSARMNRTDSRGESSVVGFIRESVSGQPQPRVGLDAASNVVWTGPTTYINTWTSDAQNSTIVRPSFASIVTKETMRPHQGSNLPFAGVQEWLYTPHRLVGCSSLLVTGTKPQTAYGIGGMIRFEGAGDFAAATGPVPRLQFGVYNASSYAVVANIKEDTFGNYVDAVMDGKFRTAQLLDTPQQTTLQTYSPGVAGHYVVDFHPSTEADATSAASVSTGMPGVYALEVKEGTDMYRLVHNTTSSPITYTATLPASDWGAGTVFIHHAYVPAIAGSTTANPVVPAVAEIPGETYRPGWVNLNGLESFSSTTPSTVALANGVVTYTVPANSHIVIVKGLTAPAGVAGAGGNAQVSLTWMASTNATSYNIFRSATQGGPYDTVATGVTGAIYTDTTVVNGTTYYYVVQAANMSGTSGYSSEASATPLSPYQQWLVTYGYPTTIADAATPDGDGVPVLLKYATGLVPGSMSVAGPAVLGSNAGEALTLQFNRLSPAQVNYMVEASSDLTHWTAVASLAAGATSWTGTASVSETGTNPIAVTITDAVPISTTTPRFLRLRVTTPTDASVPGTVPQGSIPFSFAASATTATSITVDNAPVARGTVQGVTAGSVTVAAAGTWGNVVLPYALRFLTGGAAGTTFPITAVTTSGSNYALTLATQGVDLTTLAAAGDTYEVLPEDTLASLFGVKGGQFQTGASASSADNIQLLQSGGLLTYYNDGNKWRQSGSLLTQNNTLLPPGAGMLVVRRGSTALPSYVLGRVPEVALRQFTTPGGLSFLAGPYPTNMTLAASGFATSSGWQAGSSAATADTLMLYSGNAWLTFFYNGSNWRQSGTLLNQNNYVLTAGQPMYITRKSSPAPNLSFILQPLTYTP